jgi:ribosomal protein S18 acetylase RimI-like enzyme
VKHYRARAFLEEKGVRYFTVYTSVQNQGALGFYEVNGMVPLYTTMLGDVTTAPEKGPR